MKSPKGPAHLAKGGRSGLLFSSLCHLFFWRLSPIRSRSLSSSCSTGGTLSRRWSGSG